MVRFCDNLFALGMKSQKRRAQIPMGDMKRFLRDLHDRLLGSFEIRLLNLVPLFLSDSSFNLMIRRWVFYGDILFWKLYRRAHRYPLRPNSRLRVGGFSPAHTPFGVRRIQYLCVGLARNLFTV